MCEIAYAEWTEGEQLRQTTFLGWRDDKSPEEVVGRPGRQKNNCEIQLEMERTGTIKGQKPAARKSVFGL